LREAVPRAYFRACGEFTGVEVKHMRDGTDVGVDLEDRADIYEFVRNLVNVFSTEVRAEMCGTITTEARETEKMLVRVRDEYKSLLGRAD
jgi:hypothetical protein